MSVIRDVTELDFNALKARQKETWESGDFGRVAVYNIPAAEEFMGRLLLRPGMRVLDVACGTGNLAVIAARRGCLASGIDFACNLVQQAKKRAEREGLCIDFREGDAEGLPYPDGGFDLTVSMYGVMFTPRPELAAAELVRVTRPGGTIALANWTPGGFIGQLFEVFARHLPPQNGTLSPLQWGEETHARARLRPGCTQIRCERRLARLSFPFNVPATVEFFRKFYGPTQRAFAALDAQRQTILRRELEVLQEQWNCATTPDQTEVLSEYLEVIATRA